ncbi:hypothetical protein AURDEDRAFT_86706 [Auricularia subglabra TFB-10046 SS5]|nr:hypothetical protein AURDEDRAFT_86706 [Auricularia subglabra TFB-10046 SS5]
MTTYEGRFLDDWFDTELIWVQLHGFLEKHGYRTRSRYQPGWIGSWVDNPDSKKSFMCEDGIWPIKENILDAIRVKDGAPVMMKMIELDKDPSAVDQMLYFSDESRRQDLRNHVVQLLDLLRLEDDPNRVILVQPRLLPWHIWPFKRVSEVVDFLGQIFEGLAFMHSHNTAHLDASYGNIMMDGHHLLLEPNHPSRPDCTVSGLDKVKHIDRHEAQRPVKYYFIDFDQSVRFLDTAMDHLVRRPYGQDDTVPEEQFPGVCDAFKIDVYCLGNLILIHLLNGYKNVEFIRPLSELMTRENPAERPTAQEVVDTFAVIRESLSPKQLKASPQHIRSYDFVEYLLGNVPARRPLPSLSKLVSRVWSRPTRKRPESHAGSEAALRRSQSLS